MSLPEAMEKWQRDSDPALCCVNSFPGELETNTCSLQIGHNEKPKYQSTKSHTGGPMNLLVSFTKHG